jgi:chromosome partitioning protein
MRKIALINHKGGVGKTTTAVNLAAGLHKLGKKILVVDMDPQAHLTYSLGLKVHEIDKNVYGLLKGDYNYKDIIINQNGIDVIPASLDLSGAEIELSGIPGREFLLHEALQGIDGYDFILFDCPPSLGLLTLNVLTTASEIFIPLQTEFLALQGMSKLLQAVEVVQKRLNKDLIISGIIATRFNSRKNLSREIIEKVKIHFKDKFFKIMIRDNISLAEAPSYGQHIFDYMPNSHGADDYFNLSKEVIERGVNYGQEE